jgi:transglutaminase-like putative cysteine protease
MPKKIALICFFFIFTIQLYGVPFSVIRNAGDAEDYPNSDYLVIFDSTSVEVQESGLSYRNYHKLYKVLTPEGAKKLNHLKYRYDPLSAHVDIKKVRIYRNDGTIEEIDPEKERDYPAPARMIYWGARHKMINIGNLEPGDAVEVVRFMKGFTYALLQEDTPPSDDKYVPPMEGHFYDIVEFWNDEPIRKKVYQLQLPATKDLYYKFYNGKGYVYSYTRNNQVHYTFTRYNVGPVEEEPHMVAISDIAPKLILTTTEKWEQKSLWFYNVNKDYGSFEYNQAIKSKVDEILADAQTRMDSISLLTHWVADNIRYSGLSMGEGEGYTLHKSTRTFRDRCGVCKDKAGMLVTMLRVAGFESYAAMTMARSNIEDIPADQFNHAVTLVKMDSASYKLLDPTWVPFTRELWSSLEQQQDYLMGIPGGADLKETPISPPENHYFRMNGKSTLQADGTLEGQFTIQAEGQSDAALRGMFTGNFKSNWDRTLEKKISEISPDIEILEMDYSPPYQYLEENMQITVQYRIPNYAIVTDNELLFTPVVARELFKNANHHLRFDPNLEDREHGFRDRCNRLVELHETITLPEYSEAAYIPEASKIKGSAASFEGGYQLKDNQLVLDETIRFEKRKYEADEWSNYSGVVEAQKKLAKEKVILRK